MTKSRKKGKQRRWLGLLGLAALLVVLIFIAARIRRSVGPAFSALKGRPPASLEGLKASLDSMAGSGWQAWYQPDPDSGPAQWRLSIPASCPLVTANLAIQRLSGRHGILVESASEDRKRGLLEIILAGNGGRKARLVVRKRPVPETGGQSRPLLSLVAYEVMPPF